MCCKCCAVLAVEAAENAVLSHAVNKQPWLMLHIFTLFSTWVHAELALLGAF